MSAQKWSPAELAWLRENYPTRGKAASASYLGRSSKAVAQKACDLGLKQDRTSPFFADWQARAATSKVGRRRPAQAAVIEQLWASGRIRKTPAQLMAIRARTTEEMHYQRARQCHATRQQNGTHTGHSERCAAYGAGWRVVGGKRIFFRSRWEANYARWLELLRASNKLRAWEHEPETFWFEGIKRGTLSYLPDFRVTRADGSIEYHEVKGWMTARSRTALQRMAKYHPDVKLLVIDQRRYQRLAKDVAGLIPGWEASPTPPSARRPGRAPQKVGQP